jgi:very-short-patch-repair endonuclease
MNQEIKNIQVDLAKLEEAREKHICPVCGKECKKHSKSTKAKPRWNIFCSKDCIYSPEGQAISNYLQKQSRERLHPDHEEYVRKTNEKREETNLKKFGYKNPFMSQEIKKKIEETNIKKYGHKSSMQNKEIKQKAEETCLKLYGVKNPGQIEEAKEKIKIKNRINHYDTFLKLLKAKFLEPLFDYETYLNIKNGDIIQFKCLRCGETFDYVVGDYALEVKKIRCLNQIHKYSSNNEQEIYFWLKSLGIENIERNKRNWNADKIYEADFYLPDYNLVIEYHGLYWHSNLQREYDYHYDKWKFFKSRGIECIQIFENEWRDFQNIVKSIIKNKLGMNIKLYARKCEIKEITNEEYKNFVELNHLQGYTPAKVKLGLFYNNDLVMCMSFSKPRFNKKYDWENIRTCTKINYCVVGGFSKLLSYFKQNYTGSIISYIDSRYFSGSGYIENGFEYIGHSEPNYFYFINKDNVLFNRVKFQKHKLKDILECFDENLTEKENMINNGYLWIYDCGNEIVVYNPSTTENENV